MSKAGEELIPSHLRRSNDGYPALESPGDFQKG